MIVKVISESVNSVSPTDPPTLTKLYVYVPAIFVGTKTLTVSPETVVTVRFDPLLIL